MAPLVDRMKPDQGLPSKQEAKSNGMEVALYARVSSEKQAKKDLSTSAQLRALRAFASERGWLVRAEYVDKAKSGRTANRPAFREMLVAVKRGRFDAVLVWKLDRLARNMEISAALDALFRQHRVRVISLHESIDDTPQGKLTARMFESFAEFYSNNLSQDIRRGIREVARRGFYPFSHAPIGYRKEMIQDGTATRYKLVPDEIYGEVIRRVFESYADGVTVPSIAGQLNDEGLTTGNGNRWSPKRLYDILRNRAYCGDITIGEHYIDPAGKSHPGTDPITIEDVHEPLIARSVFEHVGQILDSRSGNYSKARRVGSPYLLSGLVRCGLCGSFMAGTSAKGGRYHYYTCGRYYCEGKKACSGVRVRQERLERFVVSQVRDIVLEESNLEELVRLVNLDLEERKVGVESQIGNCRNRLKGLQSRLDRHYQALETGALELTDVAQRIKTLRESISSLEEEETELLESQEQDSLLLADVRWVLRFGKELSTTLRTGSFEEQKGFLESLIKEIRVGKDSLDIEYHLPRPQEETEGCMPSVLHSFTSGGGERIRTANLPRARRALSRLELHPQGGAETPCGTKL